MPSVAIGGYHGTALHRQICSQRFLSHASKDKDRFVLPFAVGLRAKGIDAWEDRWEMLPGDSIVQKIFEEGINNSSAVREAI
jgi:hypothetical protein